MKKWKCKVCGYIHAGDAPPDKCPVCGADKSQFERIEDSTEETSSKEDSAAQATGKWRCKVCGYVHTGAEPPDNCPVCGADKSQFEPVSEETAAETTAPSAPTDPPRHVMPDTPQNSPEDTVSSSTDANESQMPGRASKAQELYQIGIKNMLKHHVHPISTHIPNGVIPVSFTFIVLALLSGSKPLATAALCNMVFIAISLPLVLFSGYIEWQERYSGAKTTIFMTKIAAAGVVTIGSFLSVILWLFIPDILESSSKWIFIFLNLVILAAAGVAGFIGGKLVFKD